MSVSPEDIAFLGSVRRRDYQGVRKRLRHAKKLPKGTLSTAVSTGDAALIDLLLSEGNFPQTEVDSGLFAAIEASNSKFAERFLDAGASSRYVGGLVSTPVLLLAIQKRLPKIARRLIERQADPNSHDVPLGSALMNTPIGRTALMVAAEKGYDQIVEALLKAGADPWLKGAEGETAYELVGKRKGREAIAAQLAVWMKSHPIAAATRRVSGVVDQSAPLSSWCGAVEWLAQTISTKPKLHSLDMSIVRFQLSISAARTIARYREAIEPHENALCIYRLAREVLQERCGKLGAIWFLQFEPQTGIFLCGMASSDKWKVLSVFQTACANYGVSHVKLVRFLKALDAEQSFDLIDCDFTSVGGRFVKPLKNPKIVAKKLSRFCPFVVDEFRGSVDQFSEELAKTGYFKVWWD